ncbi:MAG: glycosyltransferase family A protein [Myxococcota bacterium]
MVARMMSSERDQSTQAPAVSVVVATEGHGAELERCLASLFEQELGPRRYEVIVVDVRATPETRRLVERWQVRASSERPRLEVVYLPLLSSDGMAAAYNRGWRAARGPIIAFTREECIPATTWLEEGLDALSDDVAVAQGRVLVPLPPVPTTPELDAADDARRELTTSNCFCTRAALDDVGGFDERMTRSVVDDHDLLLTFREHGRRVTRAPEAVVLRLVEGETWRHSLGRQRNVEDEVFLRRKHARLHPSDDTGLWQDAAAVTTLLVGVGGLLLGRRRVATVAAGAWLALTAQRCVERLRGSSRHWSNVLGVVATSAIIPLQRAYYRVRGAIRFRGMPG